MSPHPLARIRAFLSGKEAFRKSAILDVLWERVFLGTYLW